MSYIGQAPLSEYTSAPSKDSFTGDGSTTTFDLAQEVAAAGENALEVFINNVRQEPGTGKAYTLGNDASGDNKRITFTAAPASSAVIYVLNDKTNLTTIAPTGLDLNGVEFILDADADTTLTADTDDRIDWKIAGADHISFGTSSGDTVIKTMTDAKDILFQQYDGRTILDINDGGYVAIANGATGPGQLRLYEDTDLGTNFTAFQVGTQSGDVTYTLPTADGTDGYQLATDGSGTLSWAAAGTTFANDGNNRVVTGTGSATLNGEANLTFDGSTLAVTGAATVSTTLGVTGALTGSSTIQGTTITATTAFVPDASDGAALGTTSLEFSDLFLADGAVINFGDDQDVTLTHVADTGLLLSSTDRLQFGDSGTYIFQSADGVLDLVSDTEIELNATTLDINANVEISGTATTTGVHTFTAVPVLPANSIDSTHYVDGSIDNAHIADDQIDSEHYADGSIDTAHIADDQITLAKMAGGTDGNIISYDASGDPVAIATGSDGQVLTSAGAGQPPAFEAVSAGTLLLGGLTDVSMDITNFVDALLIQPNSDGSAPSTGTLSGATGNIGIGPSTFGVLTSGTYNTALGHNSLAAHTIGNNSVAVGRDALAANISGSGNIGLGKGAGDNITTGNNNIAIGFETDIQTATASEQINIGDAFRMISSGHIQLRPSAEDQNTCEYQANRTLNMWLDANNWGIMMWDGASSGSNYYMGFRINNNTQIGHIGGNSSNVTYNTSSDYRLKENLDYDWDATTRLKQLKPVRFNWIVDETNTLQDGFIAHEVEDIVPVAITGEKDAMEPEVLYKEGDAGTETKYYKPSDQEVIDGDKNVGDVKVAPTNIIGDVRYAETIKPQVIDPSKIVSLLVKTTQELEARITTLENA